MIEKTDICIIGGGIVGLATAYQLTRRFPGRNITILEKETCVARHQTGHNSGVLHTGIYYKPGSLKAQNCRQGKAQMEQFCKEQGIAYDICGKVIVAVDESEREALHRIHERGQANGVTCRLIDAAELKDLEPHARGVEAIHVPEAGIVNYTHVAQRLQACVEDAGGRVVTGARVAAIDRWEDHIQLETSGAGTYRAKSVINCAGLQCDRTAKAAGSAPDVRIIPFRGEYYELNEDARHLCRNLIYPVPDPSFPFLGVHFTRMIDGTVECGPNAVLALSREGYRKLDIALADVLEIATNRAFWKIARTYWRTGVGEVWRSFSKRAFVKALQRLVPEIKSDMLVRAPAGVRAQALRDDGKLLDDFAVTSQPRIVHVLNAPSPAATSSLSIGSYIADQLPAADK